MSSGPRDQCDQTLNYEEAQIFPKFAQKVATAGYTSKWVHSKKAKMS